MLNKLQTSIFACALALASVPALAEVKIGIVNTERIFKEAAPALRAQRDLKREFEKREQDLDRIAKQVKALQESLEKNGVTLADTERREKERELGDLSRSLDRRRREFQEDLNQRTNEELARVLDQANKTIKAVADKEQYDIIFQDAVYASPRIDITDKVIKALSEIPEKK